jgi:hypothetical protein
MTKVALLPNKAAIVQGKHQQAATETQRHEYYPRQHQSNALDDGEDEYRHRKHGTEIFV